MLMKYQLDGQCCCTASRVCVRVQRRIFKYGFGFLIVALMLALSAAQSRAGTVYGLKSPVPPPGVVGGSWEPVHLFSFETKTSSFTDYGVVRRSIPGRDTYDYDGLAYSNSKGLFAFQLNKATNGAVTSSELVRLSPTNSSFAVTVSTVPLPRNIRGACFDASDRLWALDNLNGELLEIDPNTGGIIGTPLKIMANNTGGVLGVSTVSDIAVRHDGTFFITHNDNIYRLPSSGIVVRHFTDTGEGLAGLAFDSNAKSNALFAYEANFADDIFRYADTTTFSKTIPYPNIISQFNAGRGDLASAVEPQPLTVSGLRNFDVVSPPGQDVNDFHIVLHGITDPNVAPIGSQIVGTFPAPFNNVSGAPLGWYPPTISTNGNTTVVNYGGLGAQSINSQTMHFGVNLTPLGEAALDEICMHWTKDGAPVFPGGNPQIPLTLVTDQPAPGELKIQIVNQDCQDDLDGGAERWIGPVHMGILHEHAKLDDLVAGNPIITASDSVLIDGPTFLASGEQITLNDIDANSPINAGDSVIVWYNVFADNNGVPGAIVGTSYTAFNVSAVPEPCGAVLLVITMIGSVGMIRRK
jgi:hypothetical protein